MPIVEKRSAKPSTVRSGGSRAVTEGARRVCKFNDAALAKFAADCDYLKSSCDCLAWMLESKRGAALTHKDSFLWLHEKIGQNIEGFIAWLPRSAGTLPAREVADCKKGKGPLCGLLGSIGAALTFVELWGVEAHPLRPVLRGMKAAADRIDCVFLNHIAEYDEVGILAVQAAKPRATKSPSKSKKALAAAAPVKTRQPGLRIEPAVPLAH
jgi:hypothetical protein